ncbi:MAG: hypothetical protein R3Y06_01140 [Faecalibacterium sp.]
MGLIIATNSLIEKSQGFINQAKERQQDLAHLLTNLDLLVNETTLKGDGYSSAKSCVESIYIASIKALMVALEGEINANQAVITQCATHLSGIDYIEEDVIKSTIDSNESTANYFDNIANDCVAPHDQYPRAMAEGYRSQNSYLRELIERAYEFDYATSNLHCDASMELEMINLNMAAALGAVTLVGCDYVSLTDLMKWAEPYQEPWSKFDVAKVMLIKQILNGAFDKEEFSKVLDTSYIDQLTEEEQLKYIEFACQYIDQYASELSESETAAIRANMISILTNMSFTTMDGEWGDSESIQAFENGFESTKEMAISALLQQLSQETDPYAIMSLGRVGVFLKTGEFSYVLSNEYPVQISVESCAALEKSEDNLTFIAGFISPVGRWLQGMIAAVETDWIGVATVSAKGIGIAIVNALNLGVVGCVLETFDVGLSAWQLSATEYTNTDYEISIAYRVPDGDGTPSENYQAIRDNPPTMSQNVSFNELYQATTYIVTQENEVTVEDTLKTGANSDGEFPALQMNILVSDATQGNQTEYFYEE